MQVQKASLSTKDTVVGVAAHRSAATVGRAGNGAGHNSVRGLGAHYIPDCILIFCSPRTATDLESLHFLLFIMVLQEFLLMFVCLFVKLLTASCK